MNLYYLNIHHLCMARTPKCNYPNVDSHKALAIMDVKHANIFIECVLNVILEYYANYIDH